MPATIISNVLSIPIQKNQNTLVSLREIKKFLDEDSHYVLNLLRINGYIKEDQVLNDEIEIVQLEENMSFKEIPMIISERGLVSAPPEIVIAILHALTKKENAQERERMLKDGRILVSCLPLLINGESLCLFIAEDFGSAKTEGECKFLLRLKSPPQRFLSHLYRLITVDF